ncbi:MAG: hypothetical protein E7410_03010 [Ruminococcaceae bacterium]|nr:hypothetical protein [Oscillospiraceae bacterium]
MKKITAILILLAMSISICFGAYASSFTDVGDDFLWAIESIEKFCEKNIIIGKGEGIFAPNDNVTRAEFAKMLALTFNLKGEGESVYSDVKKESWQHEYILSADAYTVSATLIYENAEGLYMPDKNASRQEIAYALARVLDIKADGDYLKNFADADMVNESLYEYVNAASAAGLIKGYPDNTIRPEGDVTRAEAVVLLDRALEYKTAMDTLPTPIPTAEPTSIPTPTNIPDAEPLATPKSSQDMITVVDTILASIGGEECYLIYYDFRGERSYEPLIVRPNVSVGGLKTNVADVTSGDVLLYTLQVKGNVNAIRVLYSAGTNHTNFAYPIEQMVSVPQGWGLYSSNDTIKLYYGRISETKEMEGGLRLTLAYGTNTDQMVLVPYEGVGFSVYKPYMKNTEKRFDNIDITDIKARGKDSGAHALIKTKRDVVTDVIIFDYYESYK